MKTLINKLTWIQRDQLLRLLGNASYQNLTGTVVDWESIKYILDENSECRMCGDSVTNQEKVTNYDTVVCPNCGRK